MTDLPTPVLVALGGIGGATVRWTADSALDETTVASGSAAVLLVNTTGAFLLGWLLSSTRTATKPRILALLAVGFCGSLTTMSTLAVDTAVRLDRGDWGDGLGLTALHIVLGLGAVVVGSRTAGRTAP